MNPLYIYIYKGLKIANELKDLNLICRAKIELSIFYFSQLNYKKSIELLKHCLKKYDRDIGSGYKAYIHTILGLCYTSLKDFEKATLHAKESYVLYLSIQDKKGAGESLNNLALIQMHQSNWEKALSVLKESYHILLTVGEDRQIRPVTEKIATCYFYLDNLDSSQFYNEITMSIAIKNGSKLSISNTYRNKSIIFEKKGDTQSALKWLKEHITMKDSVFNLEKNLAINNLTYKYDVVLLKKENKIQSSKYQLLFLYVGIFILLIITFFIRKQAKLKQNKLIKEKENSLLQERIKSVQKITELKDLELKELTKQIINKNILASSFKMSNMELSQQKHIDLISCKLVTTEDWIGFNNKFKALYPEFIFKLRNIQVKITQTDKTHLMLAKMGLKTKEIASTLGVSDDSVRTQKYRLNKKLKGITDFENILK
ncbi:MAG: tetratricopeptide repeat protein [Salinivirgaceae bacterium]|nr:tetratricopeptide repeat protein [Salinivirgaceae bacterium]